MSRAIAPLRYRRNRRLQGIDDVAAWQFHFELAPVAEISRRHGSLRPSTRIEHPDRAGLWAGEIVPDSLLRDLERLCPDTRATLPQHIRFGREQRTVVDVRTRGPRLEQLTVAVDIREPHVEFLGEIALLANRHEWLVISTDGRMFRPSVRRFLAEIKVSSAMRWVRGAGVGKQRRAGRLLEHLAVAHAENTAARK